MTEDVSWKIFEKVSQIDFARSLVSDIQKQIIEMEKELLELRAIQQKNKAEPEFPDPQFSADNVVAELAELGVDVVKLEAKLKATPEEMYSLLFALRRMHIKYGISDVKLP